MRIGFDAKRAVSNFTGLGNYSRYVISNLMKYYPDNVYKLFIPKMPSDDRAGTMDEDASVYSPKRTHIPFWRSMGIVKDIKNEEIDLYHGLSNELPFSIGRTKVKTVVTIHDLIFLRFPQFYKKIDRFIYDVKAKYACRVADKIVAVSECTKRDIIKYYKISPSKIEVVYQGCFPVFKEKVDLQKRQEVLKKYNLPDEFILTVGSIEERKNILLVVKALRKIPKIHFVAVGRKREYADQVMQYAVEHGIADRVHLISDVPLIDLPAMMQLAKIFVYPSLYEGFGIPIIEALNSGVPVIAAYGSCLEESGGPDSVYVNPYDDEELAFQINRLLADTNLMQKMIERGYEYVKKFTDNRCSEALMSVYTSLVNN